MFSKNALTCRRWAGNQATTPRATMFLACAILTLSVATVAAQSGDPTGFQAYPLQHRQAVDLAPQLNRLLQFNGGGATVMADTQTNRLLVSGPADAQALAAQFVQAFDRQPGAATPSGTTVQAYPVADADVQAMAAALQQQFPPVLGVRIAPDTRSRQIIVDAPPEIHQQIAQRLQATGAPMTEPTSAPAAANGQAPAATDGVPPAPQPSGQPYALANIDWRQLENDLLAVWGEQISLPATPDGDRSMVVVNSPDGQMPVLQIDRRTGQVTVLGNNPLAQEWLRAVELLDSPLDGGDEQTQMVHLNDVDPEKVRTAVSLIGQFSGQAGSGQAAAVHPLNEEELARRWGGEMLSMIFQPQRQDEEDEEEQPAEETTQVPPVEQPAETPVAEQAQAGTGMMGPVQIEYLEGLDVIVIRGHPRDVERVQKIIDDIQRMSQETQPVIEVYVMQHVSGEAMATLVSEVYEEILSPRQGEVSIRPLVDPNAVLLIGREESVAVVKDLIQRLDQPSLPASQFAVFRLKHISSVDAEQTVRNFFANRPGTDTDVRPGTGIQVRIIADYRSNSLIVQAGPRDLEEVRRLITAIDVESGQSKAELRVFHLKNALAEDLAQVLTDAITGQQQQAAAGAAAGATQARSTLPSSALEFLMVDENGARMLESGILSNIQITADSNINALLVRAPASSMELLAALIEQLDRIPQMEAQIKVFTIVNGDATSLATMLQQLFGQQVTAGTTGGLFGGGFATATQPNQISGAGANESSLIPLRFAVDVRTNSIIASGSRGDLDVVEALLVRLDEGDIETRRLAVVRLKNAPAEDVANSITSYLTTQRQLIQQQLLFNQAISPFEQIEREVIVVPEIVTNSLVVSATPQYFDEIMRVIRDLDFRPPMVMVQVLIAEVALDDIFEFGVEWGLQDSLLYDRGVGTSNNNPGFNFTNNSPLSPGLPNNTASSPAALAGQALSTLDVGRVSTNALGYGGLVLSAASDSVNILLRALQDTGRAQILARPQIMTLNNQPAFIQVGEDVPRVTASQINPQGSVSNSVQDVQTGIILRIQPRVNADGLVVMTIDAEKSFLDNAAPGVDIGNGVTAQPIRRTTAQTTLSAKTGQTVVFAGLITDDTTVGYRRIPWLSDVPVVGRLFQYESNVHERRELLIVMTPYVVESDEDYEWIKTMESQRIHWCLSDIANLHGEAGLQGAGCVFCGDHIPVIYPDVDPGATHLGPVAPGHWHGQSVAEPIGDGLSSVPHRYHRQPFEPVRPAGLPSSQPAVAPTSYQEGAAVSYGPAPRGAVATPESPKPTPNRELGRLPSP